jgi:hypothetical protein
MREQLVAWAGDCRVRGDVELGEGRLSDQVNDLDVLTFHDATLAALEDGREIRLDEVEVERRELHVIEVAGRQGDPSRRLRTLKDPVVLRIGPYTVTGSLHRAPTSQPLAALAGWAHFVPVTDALVEVEGGASDPVRREVVLVNRARVSRTDRPEGIEMYETPPWPPLPKAEPEAG